MIIEYKYDDSGLFKTKIEKTSLNQISNKSNYYYSNIKNGFPQEKLKEVYNIENELIHTKKKSYLLNENNLPTIEYIETAFENPLDGKTNVFQEKNMFSYVQGKLHSEEYYSEETLERKKIYFYNQENNIERIEVYNNKNQQLKFEYYIQIEYKNGKKILKQYFKDKEQEPFQSYGYNYNEQGLLIKKHILTHGNIISNSIEYIYNDKEQLIKELYVNPMKKYEEWAFIDNTNSSYNYDVSDYIFTLEMFNDIIKHFKQQSNTEVNQINIQISNYPFYVDIEEEKISKRIEELEKEGIAVVYQDF